MEGVEGKKEGEGSKTGVSGVFLKPHKLVDCVEKIAVWKRSTAFGDVLGFIIRASEKIKCIPLNTPRTRSQAVEAAVTFLKSAKAWIKEIPPMEQQMRFGNKAFRTWHSRLMQESTPFVTALVGPELVAKGAVQEIELYLQESFGSSQRIDYGTGHELNFVAWMAALHKISVFNDEDLRSLVFDVFMCYIDLMRELQQVYWLEPAGSKGVWGLDDYQFLPFLWGSSQLIGMEDEIQPDSIHKDAVLEAEEDNYIYLSCIKFIKKMKRGPFFEHSPLLNDISGVASWNKVHQGLITMYDKEVLAKFPVIQHFYFGSILTLDECPPEHFMRKKNGPKRGRPGP